MKWRKGLCFRDRESLGKIFVKNKNIWYNYYIDNLYNKNVIMVTRLQEGDNVSVNEKACDDILKLLEVSNGKQITVSEELLGFIRHTILIAKKIETGTQKYTPFQISEFYKEFNTLDFSKIHSGNYSSYKSFSSILEDNDWDTDALADIIKQTLDGLFEMYSKSLAHSTPEGTAIDVHDILSRQLAEQD